MGILSDYNRKPAQWKQLLEKTIKIIHARHRQIEKQSASLNNLMKASVHQESLRILLVIPAQPVSTLECEIAAGTRPEVYNYAIQKALGTDMLNLNDVQSTYSGRLITRFLGSPLALVWTAFCRRHAYDVVFTTSEIVGLPLAMLLKLSGADPRHPRHVTLAHYLSPFKKRVFFKLGVSSHIDKLIVHCAAQRALATHALRLLDERVVKLPYFVDTNFWHSLTSSVIDREATEDSGQIPMICAVGLEFRDYATLIEAVSGLHVEVRIAAAGNHKSSADLAYGTAKMPADLSRLPTNVLIRSYNYVELRELYTEARFVVVPLCERDAPAGVTVILEAMAMGKAVIVSGTRGQTDVVRDPRNDGRGFVVREWWPGFLDAPSVVETLGSLPTGFYVTPADPHELRDTIQYLLDHPEISDELGRNGQRVAEAYFSLEALVQRFAAAIRGESHLELEHFPHS